MATMRLFLKPSLALLLPLLFSPARSQGPSSNVSSNPAGQLFEALPSPPPLPIMELERDLAALLSSGHAPPRPYIVRVVAASDSSTSPNPTWLIGRQATPRQCDSQMPCPDSSCCNRAGRCGYGPEMCGADVCVSNCAATADCGRHSRGASVACPLNVCCGESGFCGAGDPFCGRTCQPGFGSCDAVEPPVCAGRSAYGRTIGYYQLANVRERRCNRIAPRQIRTEGLTHLYAAFATIDPETFAVKPSHPDDVALYGELTALKRDGLETWIAIGGWAFSDPGPTRTTFSDLCLNASRRRRFIHSLVAFLEQHGFQGVDMDWEYPGAADRGGRPDDGANYATLLGEMRAVFGRRFGISAALPPSYWYLRGFRPQDMAAAVDWLGVMAYDLHGPWDAAVAHVGPVVLGHTNVPELADWTLPLYYAGVAPAKLNLGLAYYARGYTTLNATCVAVGCTWRGPSRAAPCTDFGGVMSRREVERLLAQRPGLTPRVLRADMMAELAFDDQWLGYDNDESIEMKKTWASGRCYGGTMIWSVDMDSGPGSGDVPDGGSASPEDPSSGHGK